MSAVAEVGDDGTFRVQLRMAGGEEQPRWEASGVADLESEQTLVLQDGQQLEGAWPEEVTWTPIVSLPEAGMQMAALGSAESSSDLDICGCSVLIAGIATELDITIWDVEDVECTTCEDFNGSQEAIPDTYSATCRWETEGLSACNGLGPMPIFFTVEFICGDENDPCGVRLWAEYPALGMLWETIIPFEDFDPLATSYDTSSRRIRSTTPLGNISTTGYNNTNQRIASVDPLNRRTSSVTDALGRRTVDINALGNRTTTVYNSLGQTSDLVDARGNQHSFTHDSAGVQTQLIDPLDRRTTNGYDEAGQQRLRIDARSNRTTYAYSTVGQLTSRKYPDGSRATFSFTAAGGLPSQKRPADAAIDAMRHLREFVRPISGRSNTATARGSGNPNHIPVRCETLHKITLFLGVGRADRIFR